MEAQKWLGDEMVRRHVKREAQRLEALKANPLPELEKLSADAVKAAQVYTSDKVLYRIAVGVLGALALNAAIGSIVLVILGNTTPEVLVALGSTALGPLVGLFAPTPTSG